MLLSVQHQTSRCEATHNTVDTPFTLPNKPHNAISYSLSSLSPFRVVELVCVGILLLLEVAQCMQRFFYKEVFSFFFQIFMAVGCIVLFVVMFQVWRLSHDCGVMFLCADVCLLFFVSHCFDEVNGRILVSRAHLYLRLHSVSCLARVVACLCTFSSRRVWTGRLTRC